MKLNLSHAFRHLLKSPGFACVAIVVMALGIGANTAIFSLVHAVLIQALPFEDAERLVQLWHTPPQASFPGVSRFTLSAANFLDWQKQSQSFESMAIYRFNQWDITGGSKPESVTGSKVSADFFATLGVKPIFGRTLLADEDRVGNDHVAVLSYRLWQSRFGGDRSIVGRDIELDGEKYTVVGVMGPKMLKPSFAMLWVPMAMTDKQAAVRGEHSLLGIARLRRGVTVQQAQAELSAISKRLELAYPADDKGWGALVVNMREDTVSEVKPALLMMLGAVAFVLLIACANVANLVLARALSRKKEIAIRAALGASRARLILQIITESVLVSLVGGALGLVVAHFGIELLLKFFAAQLPRFGDIGLNTTVLFFALLLSVLTGVLAGLLPAWSMSSSADIHDSLKQGLGRSDVDTTKGGARGALVVIEVALSLMLLIGAGLMLRSLWNLQKTDLGFDRQNAMSIDVMVSKKHFSTPEQETLFFNNTLARVRALPGVEAAGAVDSLPLQGGSNQPIAVEGRPVLPMSEQPEVSVRVFTPGYMRAMHIPLLEGRDVTDADSGDSASVVVISKSMAKQFWPNESAIGHHLTLTFFPDKVREVVGVVGDVKQDGVDSDAGISTVYWPLAQYNPKVSTNGPWSARPLTMVVRSTVPPTTLTAGITNAVREVNKDVPVDNAQTLEAFLDQNLTQQSFNMMLLSIFAGLALLLSAVGIYSVLAYAVRRRMREIGLRMALGASLRDVVRMVVVQGLKPTLIGIAVGLGGALLLGRLVSSLIYGVTTRDFATYISVTVLLVAVSFFASLLPAFRAAKVDPLTVLREE